MDGVRIGTSGWSYDHWAGVLYPPGAPAASRLARYVEAFDTVELNASFYRWPKTTTFEGWARRLPPGFALTVKAPRWLTHARKLHQPEPWLERIAEAWRLLGDRAGVLLVQLPPDLERDDARLAWFCAHLPPGVATAVEFRHPSWLDDAVFAILERHGVAYVVMSGARLPCVLRATAPFVYVRWHGPDHDHLYAGSYSDDDLRWWADRIGEWTASGLPVWGYFNNDGHGHAVRNAWRLRELLLG
ncbi:MAG: DUF72 domain-containing protein [Kineosporiaceae bacterium]